MNFYELAQIIGKPDPVPLRQIPPVMAKTAVTSGEKDGEKPADQIAVNTNASGPVMGLSPTQNQLKSTNFVGMAISNLAGSFDLTNMNAIVSADNAIMDGHHRWAAALCINPNQSVNYVQINLPLDKLITLLNVYTKGALNKDGKPAKGESISKAFQNAKGLFAEALTNGWKGEQASYTKEQVAEAYGKIQGANGDAQRGLQVLQQNIDGVLQNSKLLNSKTNLERKDMPVIEIGNNAKAAIQQLVNDIQDGKVDINAPFSQDVKNAAKVDSSTGQQSVAANQQGQVNQQSVGANQQGQAIQQNVAANQQGNVTQQNIGANQQNLSTQQQLRPNNQVQFRQVASTTYEEPSLNEWLVLAGINGHKN